MTNTIDEGIPNHLRILLHPAGFRQFTESDWDGFAGCTSKEPWIRYDEDCPTIILDGTTVCTLIVTDPEAIEH